MVGRVGRVGSVGSVGRVGRVGREGRVGRKVYARTYPSMCVYVSVFARIRT